MPDMHDPATFSDFFARTLDFALLPYISRHPLAAAAEINGIRKVWERIQGQPREGVRNSAWCHKDSVDEIGVIFAQLLYRIGACLLPRIA